MAKHTWRKSRRSENNMNCVELRDTFDAVRDSKNLAGSVLRGNIRALVRAVRAGQFDR